VYDDGGGPELYAGGNIQAGVVRGVARWDGTSWSHVGSGTNHIVLSLTVHDDGGGPALYAGGLFTSAGGVAARYVARWKDSCWSPLGGGVELRVEELVGFDLGAGPELLVAGRFETSEARDSFVARWARGEDVDPPVLHCPDELFVLDEYGSPSGEVVDYVVTASDCGDPAPTVVCVPPSGSVFPRGATLVTCTATDASGNEATCAFPVTVGYRVRRR
jgi:hypothetical protein